MLLADETTKRILLNFFTKIRVGQDTVSNLKKKKEILCILEAFLLHQVNL